MSFDSIQSNNLTLSQEIELKLSTCLRVLLSQGLIFKNPEHPDVPIGYAGNFWGSVSLENQATVGELSMNLEA